MTARQLIIQQDHERERHQHLRAVDPNRQSRPRYDRQRPSPDASIRLRIAVVVDGQNRGSEKPYRHPRDQRRTIQSSGTDPIGAAHGAQAKEGGYENFAERRVGNRPWTAGVGPAGQDRQKDKNQDWPTTNIDGVESARVTAAAVSRPCAVTRGGPTRSGPSPPRLASAASLYKFVPICTRTLAQSTASRAPHWIFPATAQASAAPTTTGTIDKLSVRGRAAA